MQSVWIHFSLPVGILAFVLSGCNLKQELGLSYIPPVLSEPLNLASTEAQSHQFDFGRSGVYVLHYRMELRHGAGSSPHSYKMAGILSIRDAAGAVKLRESFEADIGPNVVGGELIRFKSKNVAGSNPHTLSIVLAPAMPGFLESYTSLRIWLQREPAHPIID
jgi:hypothetical protein